MTLTRSLRIAVIGASGFIGTQLVPTLNLLGHRVVAISRRRVDDFPSSVPQVRMGDLADEINWTPVLAGVDVVIHLAAIAHAIRPVPEASYEKVNHLAVTALARHCSHLGARLIFISSVAAQIGPSHDRVVTEKDPAQPVSSYGRSKLNAERDVAATNVRYVILRPPLVYGRAAKGNMRRLIQLAKLPFPLPFRQIQNKRSLLGIRNFCAAIEFLIAHDEIDKEIFLIADPAPLSLPEMITSIREGMGREPSLFAVPPRVLHSAFGMLGMWERLAGNLVVSTERFGNMGYTPMEGTKSGLAFLGANG
jgi:UDP-glucose 4-epimerase